MTGPLDPTIWEDPNVAANTGVGMGSPYGAPFGVPLYNLPDFKRQAAFEALTDAGLGLIKASAPSPYPTDGATLFGALAGGAAQGGRDASQRYMQRAMMAGQIRNLALQNQMYPAALKALNSPGQYDPYGGGQGGAPQPQPQAPDSNGPMTAGAPNDNNIGNVKTPDLKGFAQVPDFNSGVKLAADTVRSYGNGKSIAQIASIYAPPSENDTGAWVKNVASISGLDPTKPLDLTEPQTAAALVRGIHGAEKGGNAVQPLANYLPGVTGKFTPVQYTPQQGQPAPQGTPQFPANPPDPSKYNALRMLGGQWAKQADALYERDKQRYEAAKNLYESQMKVQANRRAEEELALSKQKAARETATGELIPDPQNPGGYIPNPVKIQAETQKKIGEAKATEEARKIAIFGGPNWDKLPPDELRKVANPEALSLVDQVQSGQTKIEDVSARAGTGGIAVSKNDVMALGKKLYGDEWDPNAGDRRQKFEADTTDQSSQTGKTLYSINTVYKHINRFQDLTDALGNKQTPIANEILRIWNNTQGNAKYTTPEALQHALGTEIAAVIKGQQLNEPEVEAAIDTIKTTKSPEQMHGALGVLRHAMGDRESTIMWAARRSKVPESRIKGLIDPDARAAIDKFDANQAAFAQAHPEGGAPAPSPANRPPLTSFMRQSP